jgi:hypothetical protein
MTIEDLSTLSLRDRRRAILSRAADRQKALGTPIDGDNRFMELVSRWIDGELEMGEVSKLYRQKRKLASQAAMSGFPATHISSNEERLPMTLSNPSLAEYGELPSAKSTLPLARMTQEQLLKEIDSVLADERAMEAP